MPERLLSVNDAFFVEKEKQRKINFKTSSQKDSQEKELHELEEHLCTAIIQSFHEQLGKTSHSTNREVKVDIVV
jgi:hypothetical protein